MDAKLIRRLARDMLPSIGWTGQYGNIYYSTGYNGHGLAFSQLAGKMIGELMAGERSDLTDHVLINKPIRGAPSASIAYAAAMAEILYYRISDWLTDRGK